METFQNMGLPEPVMYALQRMQFKKPTPIQAKAIPIALQGKDILGSAQTGTGKTGAFGIPLITRLLRNPSGSALVIAPTRELAIQIMNQLKAISGEKTKIVATLLIGGDSMPKQLSQLKNSPRIIVGTPGRINDHIKRKSLKLHDTDFLVLDETDRMFDMGFSIQIEKIIRCMAKKRQTLLFSATLPKNIIHIVEKYLTAPTHILINEKSILKTNIKQDILRLGEAEKYQNLIFQLNERNGSVLIFVKTKSNARKMAIKLSKEGLNADALHGDLIQKKRNRVVDNFRNKKHRILIATDVASRGLDIPHIKHVINYDLPQCAEDYVHRIGRTGRTEAEGFAFSFITPSDENKWNAINRFINPNAKHSHSPNKKRRPSRKFKRWSSKKSKTKVTLL